MRISGQPNNINPQVLGEERVKGQPGQQSQPAQGRSPAAGDATISGHTLSLLNKSLHQGDDIRYEKVAALRAAIADGSYQVSGEQIADAMMRDMQG